MAAGVACAATAQEPVDRPWQRADGTITVGNQVFQSWKEYHQSRIFLGTNDFRCGTDVQHESQDGEPHGFLGGGPSDCSYGSTNPSDAYDPSVVTYRIPVVVHVIRDSSGSQGNITESKVESGIRILNEDFNALAGTNGEDGNDCRVEFFLAEVDPNGNPTNGITYSNNSTWFNDGGSYWNSLAWDPDNYMNVYTNTASGALGYVPFLPQDGNPGANEDRVVVLWSTYGEDGPYGPPFDQGRTLTHEVGHYLGLFHVFDGCGGNCSTSGDRVCDTNPQSSPTWGCSNANSCSSADNIRNYMDYSDDLCMEEFTPQQNRRMRCTLEHYRPELAETGGGGGGGGGGNDCQTDCAGDLNENGIVDGGDLGLMIAAWGSCGESACCADFNNDGEVNGGDLGTLLGAWGECEGDPCDGVNCDDNDPCTQDSCVNGNCVNTPIDGCGGEDGCGAESAGPCEQANGTPYCSDGKCCESVCASDPYCCETEWDQLCAEAVPSICNGGGGGGSGECGDPNSGSCEIANGTPYCSDEACCEAICDADPFCCDTEWDQICADASASESGCQS
ncbi:MAG: hypothetical protein MK085_07700 [Phycisphaerales bacterium]|nr:hypothetical protein [Phycisphaerales bacterium]